MSESPDAFQHSDSPFRACVRWLYANSRPQFHPALYALLCGGMCVFMFSVTVWAMNLLFGWNLIVDFEMVGFFVAILATAELVKGLWKHWAGKSASEWSFPAIAAGGASSGLVASGLQTLRWGVGDWLDYAAGIAFCTASYLLLSWLFYKCKREGTE